MYIVVAEVKQSCPEGVSSSLPPTPLKARSETLALRDTLYMLNY